MTRFLFFSLPEKIDLFNQVNEFLELHSSNFGCLCFRRLLLISAFHSQSVQFLPFQRKEYSRIDPVQPVREKPKQLKIMVSTRQLENREWWHDTLLSLSVDSLISVPGTDQDIVLVHGIHKIFGKIFMLYTSSCLQ